jgi:release factor glutamine methyltransferase
MNNTDLKKIYLIRQILEDSGYFDIERISNEIYEYSDKNNTPLEDILGDIKKGKPWEYIKGEAEFYKNIFKITEDTLIPRVETEDLVGITKEEIKKYSPSLVIDTGTGSGCIILSLAKYFCNTDTRFIGTDISRKALNIAKENRKLLKLKNVSFKRTNLLKDINPKEKYCIVANLPYIPTDMYLNLDKSVKDYEPEIALNGGEDGLRIYEELFKQIQKKKNKPEFMVLEFEPSTKKSLERILNIYFKDSEYIFKKDFRDKERFLVCLF